MNTFFAAPLLSLLTLSCMKREFNTNADSMAKVSVSKEARISAIRRATVWIPGSDALIATKDLYKGPTHDLFKVPEKSMECQFAEPKESPQGRTPKFNCVFDEDKEKKEYKVKYDPYHNIINDEKGMPNEEVYGEILSTRLLWALGFPADRIYAVNVNCRLCPPDPWLYIRRRWQVHDALDHMIGFVREDVLDNSQWLQRAHRIFHPAVVEDKFPGDTIIQKELEGWSWKELFEHMENPELQRPQREALTLLMAFVSHMDSQPSQQRILCKKKSWSQETCTEPILMVQDVGSSFGNGWSPLEGNLRLNKLDMKKWKQLDTWEDRDQCIVNVHAAPNGTLFDQPISEKGRLFLANLMQKLTRQQISDLFRAARIDLSQSGGNTEQWVDAFMKKMERDILKTPCKN